MFLLLRRGEVEVRVEDDEGGRERSGDYAVTGAGGEEVLEEGDGEISGIGEDTCLVEKEEGHQHGEGGEHLGVDGERERRERGGKKEK